MFDCLSLIGPELQGGFWGCHTPQKFHSEVQWAELYFSRQTKIFFGTKQYCRRDETKIFFNQKLLGSRKNMLSVKFPEDGPGR